MIPLFDTSGKSIIEGDEWNNHNSISENAIEKRIYLLKDCELIIK